MEYSFIEKGFTLHSEYQQCPLSRALVSCSTIFHIIGQGTGNNFLRHEKFDITINAMGVVSAFVDNFSVDCR